MYEELQVVRAVKKLSDKVELGCIGTIVCIYIEGSNKGYEVEFINDDYETLDVLTVTEGDIEIIKE